MDEETVKKTVLDAFNAENKSEGRYGWELPGKGQWFKGPEFDNSCLEGNDLAFRDHKKPGRITPTYEAQRWLTASTERGYCIDMGENLSIEVVSVKEVTELSGGWDIQNATIKFTLEKPSPWFKCLLGELSERVVRVEATDSAPAVNESDLGFLTFQPKNNCPSPLVKAEKRGSNPRPVAEPSKGPSLDKVKSIAQKFDGKLYDGKFHKALEAVSCVDLFVPQKWGNCAVSEVLSLGHSTRGQMRPQDGTPWLENELIDFGALKKIKADSLDKTMYHVLFEGRRSKKTRSFTVQWKDGDWKLLGALSLYDSGLTPLRFINDLHDKATRDIFERRLNGEAIDHRGELLDPNAAPAEDKK